MFSKLLRYSSLFFLFILMLQFTACKTASKVERNLDQDGAPISKVDVSKIPDAVPKKLKKSRYGNPPVYAVEGRRYRVLHSSRGYHAVGVASWYGTKFHHKRTSSGEPYDMFLMTAAHRTLPIPTFVKVTSLENGKEVVVKVNDRGPFRKNRLIDLSYVAARKLGIYGRGTGLVKVEIIDPVKSHQKLIRKATNYAKYEENDSDETSSNQFSYLQLGVFSKRENAERLLTQVKNVTNKPLKLQKDQHIKQTVYRVLLGPFVQHANLSSLQERFAQLGIKATLRS